MSVLRFFVFLILSTPLYAAPNQAWVAPTHCNTKSEKIEAIENLLQSVCVLDGQGGHICGDKAQVLDLKTNKVVSEMKIEKPIANAVETVITKSSDGESRHQVHMVTTEGEIQKYDPLTKDLQSVKLDEALYRLASSQTLEAPLREFIKNQDLSNNISNLASKASFSSDGKFLILPQENQDLRIPVEQLFETSQAQQVNFNQRTVNLQPLEQFQNALSPQKLCPKKSTLIDFLIADRDCVDESNQKDRLAFRPRPALILDPFRGNELNLKPENFGFSLNPFSAINLQNLGHSIGQKITKALQSIPLGIFPWNSTIFNDSQSVETFKHSEAGASENLRLVSSSAAVQEYTSKAPSSKNAEPTNTPTSRPTRSADPSLKLADELLAKLGLSSADRKMPRDDEFVRALNQQMKQKLDRGAASSNEASPSGSEQDQRADQVIDPDRNPSKSVAIKNSLKSSMTHKKQTQDSSNKNQKPPSRFTFEQDPFLILPRRRRLLLARPNESF